MLTIKHVTSIICDMYMMCVKQCDKAGYIMEATGETQMWLTIKQPREDNVWMSGIYDLRHYPS